FFFFSSRRRHTRSYGDWSSDVCSSDLRRGGRRRRGRRPGGAGCRVGRCAVVEIEAAVEVAVDADPGPRSERDAGVGPLLAGRRRSEERRGGKRWGTRRVAKGRKRKIKK